MDALIESMAGSIATQGMSFNVYMHQCIRSMLHSPCVLCMPVSQFIRAAIYAPCSPCCSQILPLPHAKGCCASAALTPAEEHMPLKDPQGMKILQLAIQAIKKSNTWICRWQLDRRGCATASTCQCNLIGQTDASPSNKRASEATRGPSCRPSCGLWEWAASC